MRETEAGPTFVADGFDPVFILSVLYSDAPDNIDVAGRLLRLSQNLDSESHRHSSVHLYDNSQNRLMAPRGVYYSWTGENIGFGAAVNRLAAGLPSHGWLILLNPDLELDSRELQGFIIDATSRPSSVVSAPALKSYDGSRQTWSGSLRIRTPFQEVLDALGICTPQSDAQVEYFRGAALAIHSTVFQRAGGFDERYFLYFEEADLFLRLHGQVTTRFLSEYSILHRGGGGLATKSCGAAGEYMASQIIFTANHSGRVWAAAVRLAAEFGLLQRLLRNRVSRSFVVCCRKKCRKRIASARRIEHHLYFPSLCGDDGVQP